MPRVSQRDVLADRQNAAQPALFDDSQFPMEAGALESIRARRYEHRGVRLTEDDAKAERLTELLLLKWGVKKISREMNISPHTVRAARRLLAAQGKLDPYKKRVVDRMEDAIEAAVEHWATAVEEGRVPAAQIPVGMAIMFDKRALAMGEPTSISGATGAGPDGLKVEDINAYLESLPSCKTAPDDSQSIGLLANAKQIGVAPVKDVTLDGSEARPNGVGPDAGTVAGGAQDRARDARGPGQVGGGGGAGAGGPEVINGMG